jgi:hypothetical protein
LRTSLGTGASRKVSVPPTRPPRNTPTPTRRAPPLQPTPPTLGGFLEPFEGQGPRSPVQFIFFPFSFPNGPTCNKTTNPKSLATALAAATGANDDHGAEATALEAAMLTTKNAPKAPFGGLVFDP